jgi:LysM repeat protein
VMPCGAVERMTGTAARQVGYSARVADEPFLPQFPDAPTLPDTSAALPGAGAAQRPPPPALSDEDLEPEPKRPRKAQRKSGAEAALPWLLAFVVVVLLAASGGLVSAWIVATMRAVPAPALADVTPSPSPAASGGGTAVPTLVASDQPRHTPTPAPVVTQEPAPFIHVVQAGEYLQYIADLYGVTVEDIVALNDIKNPNRIRVGRELLIPGYGHRPSPSPG